MDSDQAQRLLEESTKDLFEHSPCGYVCVRSDGRIANVNDTFLKLTGQDRKTLQSGMRFRDLLTVPGRIYYETHLVPLLRMQGFVKEVAFDLLRPNNEPIPVLINAAEKRASDGTSAFTWFTVFDSTDRRQYERELIAARKLAESAAEKEKAAREEAEAANRTKDQFLALLSHELRSPLGAILGWVDLLRRHLPEDRELQSGLAVIDRNARVQGRLIDDLLDMSRVLSGKMRLEVQRVELATVIEEALETARPTAETKAIRLQKVLDSTVFVSGDSNRLQQVFWNLLSNSMKFTPKEGYIRVVMQRVNSHVEISVIDSGQGMKADFIAHAFERFRQSDSTSTRRTSGLGIGLSLVKHLVEMHGGSIAAKSEGEGKGSTFIISLPLAVVHEVHPPRNDRHPDAVLGGDAFKTLSGVSLNGVRVLVVDDEPDAREMLRRLLERFHADVTTAASASEALEQIQRRSPDVLVSDIGMPDEDGFELIRRVRMLGGGVGNLKAIALTAFAQLDDRTQVMLAGFDTHLSKPAEPNELIITIASLAGVLKR